MKRYWALLVSLAVAGVLVFSGFSNELNTSQVASNKTTATIRYEIDPAKSKFMVEAPRAGLLWFKGKDHHLAVRDFSGWAEITPGAINPASLEMVIRSSSLEETSDEFTEKEKGIINKELDEIVLEAAKYPEIRFKSTNVEGELKNGRFEVEIEGELTMHGVTRQIEIPAMVSVDGNEMRAIGEFSLNRKDFNVKATSAFHGLVRVGTRLKFTFDIVSRRV